MFKLTANILFVLISLSAFSQNTALSMIDANTSVGSKIIIKAIPQNQSYGMNKYHFNTAAFDKLAHYLLENRSVNIEIACFSDFADSPLLSLMDTKFEAEEIRNYLVRKGVEGTRMVTTGYGDMFPLREEYEIENLTDTERIEASLENRRIEIIIIKKG